MTASDLSDSALLSIASGAAALLILFVLVMTGNFSLPVFAVVFGLGVFGIPAYLGNRDKEIT